MVRIIRFDEALSDAHSRHRLRPSVLIGNGFSTAYDPRIFAYKSIAEHAEMGKLGVARSDLFATLRTDNFEVVSEKLRSAAELYRLYFGDGEIVRRWTGDAKKVRLALAASLAALHPDSAMRLTSDQAKHARVFLHSFRRIYTVNYDLLLYWAIQGQKTPRPPSRDGFARNPPGTGPLVWTPNPSWGPQQVYYLHGALHLFERKKVMEKLNNRDHGRLLDEIRDRLSRSKNPRVITEGRADEKAAKIAKSPYLSHASRNFEDLDGALFIHGMSLSGNDDHLLSKIEAADSRVSALYVSLYGNASPDRDAVIARARRMRRARNEAGGDSLRLTFYDAATADVWGSA